MRSMLAICLILVCFVDKSYGTFADFLNNLPTEISSAFSSAWSSITEAIKKPVRIKRLGPGGRLKTSTTSTTQSTSLSWTFPSDSPKGHHHHRDHSRSTRDNFVPTTSTIRNRLTLPLLPAPKFKTLEEWREMQKAHYAERKKVQNPAPIVILIDAPHQKSPQGISHFGDESFATMLYI